MASFEWHFTLMDSTALPEIALDLTHRDCIELEITRQIEIHRTVLQWARLDWTGMDYCTWLLWTWDVPNGNTLQSTCVDGTSH